MESKQSLDEGQAKKVLDELALAATEVYYSGYPSRTTLEVYFPKGVVDIREDAGNGKTELIFEVGPNAAEIREMVTVFPFDIDIGDPATGGLSMRDGRKKILVESVIDGDGNTDIKFSEP
jgi:hypothetical protein